jgi:hypothetical protein
MTAAIDDRIFSFPSSGLGTPAPGSSASVVIARATQRSGASRKCVPKLELRNEENTKTWSFGTRKTTEFDTVDQLNDNRFMARVNRVLPLPC